MRSVRMVLATLGLGLLAAAASCDDKEPAKAEGAEASAASTAAPASASAPPPAIADAGTTAASTWDGSMPPRPIPKPAMTVGSGMPAEVQMKTIAYMTAMSQPRFDDAPAEAEYASGIATQLRPVVLSFDKGSPEERARLDRVDVIAGGRRLDLLMAEGCNSDLPHAATQRIGLSFSTLMGHGVLVVKCNDSRVQCLQSTRDPSDVLCTTAPRHR